MSTQRQAEFQKRSKLGNSENPWYSLQMMERPLLTPNELKSLPKGEFVVMKTGVHPMRVKLKLFFKWGIQFDEKNPYTVPDNGGRAVEYAEKKEISDGIMKKYPPKRSGKEETRSTDAPAGQEQGQRHEPKKAPAAKPSEKKGGGAAMRPVPPSRRTPLNKQEGIPHEPS